MFIAIFEYIDRVFASVRPRKLLYMAIDGVAPRAKMNQQRSRRFRAAKERLIREEEEAKIREMWKADGREVPEKKEGHGFDSNVITPGTPFMDRLAHYLRFYIKRKVHQDAGWQNISIIFSDASVPGEGEHKIMEFIRLQRTLPTYNPNTRHCIHGLDADLIMLALATHEPHFTILREEVTFGKSQEKCAVCDQPGHSAEACTLSAKEKKGEFDELGEKGPSETPFQFLRVNVLREYLLKEYQLLGYDMRHFDFERAIDDFVFLCCFCGNDFLPHLPSLSIRDGAIDKLLKLFKEVFDEMGGFITKDGEVDLVRVERVLKSLGEVEDEYFREKLQDAESQKSKKLRRSQDVTSKKTTLELEDLQGRSERQHLNDSDKELLLTLNKVQTFNEEESEEPLDLRNIKYVPS